MLLLRRSIFISLFSLLLVSPVFAAGDRASPDEAVAMVKRGLSYIKENGKEKAFVEFANKSNKDFHDRDLYLFAYDLNGVNLSHGNNPKMNGKNMIDLKVGDKFVVKEMLAVVKSAGKGWVEYQWPNPVTKMLETKSTYVEKVDDYFIGCGVYK
ncbi:cache domain-containing protein [Undibacterium jejuense]|uniref:Cache domain-containing protein n=1 Tax=Undibacterium jejuense TaxID=1344949 RepID=A0A923KNB3_9BURK|nr:cache domain-containing protein [Undibacterium jejuense]MBC3861673.1 cache domain-containing protein [Undibacterium jejuense]